MNQKTAIQIIQTLIDFYPDATCSLDFSTPFEMLVAVSLSAQCTDERVNQTTPAIFAKYSTPQDFKEIRLEELENLIHPCGFYKNKAKNLKAAGTKIVDEYGGIVPQTMEELMTIPGVGRKSANVIMLEAFHQPQGIAVDTHAKRISHRLGLSKKEDPSHIEQDLLKLFPKKYWKDVNHILVWHGRKICTARNPKCSSCPIQNVCKEFQKSCH